MSIDVRQAYIKFRNDLELTENEKLELINFCDFDIQQDDNGFKLIDLQGANLNGIMEERFDTLDNILDRIGDIYLWDYFVRSGEITEKEIK
jgi:hypothetical protein